MKEYKIGEKFIWEGKELVCVEEAGLCEGCFFDSWHDCSEVLCEARERKDGKAVMFKEVIKKQEIKIIRKFDELAGLDNGKGLYLEKGLLHNSEKIFLKFKGEPQSFDLDSTEIEDVALLKAMGFEFEWKPKLTKEEVSAKYETVEFNENSKNYMVVKVPGKPYVVWLTYTDYFGAKCYTKKDAEAMCKELNSKNYMVVKVPGKPYVVWSTYTDYFGAKCYTKKDAEAMCKELNG